MTARTSFCGTVTFPILQYFVIGNSVIDYTPW